MDNHTICVHTLTTHVYVCVVLVFERMICLFVLFVCPFFIVEGVSVTVGLAYLHEAVFVVVLTQTLFVGTKLPITL